jgi:hypothetical protein
MCVCVAEYDKKMTEAEILALKQKYYRMKLVPDEVKNYLCLSLVVKQRAETGVRMLQAARHPAGRCVCVVPQHSIA